jgi:hypothetical protein
MHNPYLTSNLATSAEGGVLGKILAGAPDLDIHTGILEATLEAERRWRIEEKHAQLLKKPVVINLHVQDMQQTRRPPLKFSTTLCLLDYWRDHNVLFSWLVGKVPFDTWLNAFVTSQDQRACRFLFPDPYPGSRLLQGSEQTSVRDDCQSLLFGSMLNIQDFDELYAGAEDSVSESIWLVTIWTQSAELPRIV